MIISDTYKFCFVHIPKCAGSSIRGPLQKYDDTHGRFTGFVGEHDVLGRLDYVHIPLNILREYFPLEYEKIKAYKTFATVRDPYARFPSSLAQRINSYGAKPVHEMSKGEIVSELDRVIEFLSSNVDAGLLPADYIHFQRQGDYLFDEGKLLVDKIYQSSDVKPLLEEVSRILGKDLLANTASHGARANKTLVFRSEFMKQYWPLARTVLSWPGQLLPERLKQIVRDNIYSSMGDTMKDVFESPHVRSFIEDYYANDVAFVAKLKHEQQLT